MSTKTTHHYTESGLPNVWIECQKTVDDAGETTYIIPAINRIHKAIAQGIVLSDGALTGAEIKFLRTEMGWTQTELGELVHRTRPTIARWESGDGAIDGAADALLRILAIDKLKLKKAPSETITRKHDIASNTKKAIRIAQQNHGHDRLAA